MSLHEVDEALIGVNWRSRETESVPMNLPKTVIASLEKVAASRDMSIDALLKLYIGKGLRQDLSDLRTKTMETSKRERLEAQGWKVGDAADFLGLTSEESVMVENGDYVGIDRTTDAIVVGDACDGAGNWADYCDGGLGG
jgi:hypothetical protein